MTLIGMRSIDVHHHILPHHYVDGVGADAIGSQGSSGRLPEWGVERSIELMDAAGIQAAVTSVSAPGVSTLDHDDAVAMARSCNELAAGMVSEHPTRFGMFATLPLHEVDDAVVEADYALDALSAEGVCLLTNYEGHYLGDPRFVPLYEHLERHRAVVFVHPTSPQLRVDVPGLSPSMLEFPFDTTRTIASLLFSGVITAFPSIRWIFSHAGGALPYLAGRLEVLLRNNVALSEGIGGDYYAALRTLYFDTALSADRMHVDALRALVPDSQLLFGSDYPFGPRDQMSNTAMRLAGLGLSDATQHAVASGNAAGLFPRLTEAIAAG